jgi:hypothetical protein
MAHGVRDPSEDVICSKSCRDISSLMEICSDMSEEEFNAEC